MCPYFRVIPHPQNRHRSVALGFVRFPRGDDFVKAPVKIYSILAVDDDPLTTSAMKRVLEPLGYAVAIAPNGRAAVQVLNREVIDLVITDILMPDGDGFELIEALRKNFPYTRIIAISAGAGSAAGLTADTFLLIARGMRVDGILRKPITRDELVLAIQAIENRAPPPGTPGWTPNKPRGEKQRDGFTPRQSKPGEQSSFLAGLLQPCS